MAKFKAPSAAVMAARARRGGAAKARITKIEWFIKEVSDKVALTMKQRVFVCTELLHAKTVRNISKAVRVGVGPRGGRVVTGRSKPGEFPRADTTQLMKTLFKEVVQVNPNWWDGYVGTPLDYGLILETSMQRSFLRRTLLQEVPRIERILSGPIK